MVRLAPIAQNTSYVELWQAAQALRGIIGGGAYLEASASGLVT